MVGLTSQERIDWWNANAPVGVGSGIEAVTTQVALTPAQIYAMNATPLTLVSASTDYLYVVEWVHFERPTATVAPTAYTAGGAIEVRRGATVLATAAVGLLTGAAPQYYFVPAPTTAVTTALITTDYGVALTLSNLTAAFATGTGNLNVTLRYKRVPKAASAIQLEA